MSLIVTFLGKGGSGRTTMAIAAAKKLAQLGSRVLLVGQDPSPAWNLLLGASAETVPREIASNLAAVRLLSTVMLEQNWEQIKELEAQYLRSPTLKTVYGQELGILPGMDEALALDALREYDKSGKYDVILYDGAGDIATLRMFGIPEIASWYARRFQKVLTESDLGKALSPFVQPIASAVLSGSWNLENLVEQPQNRAADLFEAGKQALADPNRVTAYLVTTEDPAAIATAKYLWGSAQQIGLAVRGVLFNQAQASDAVAEQFSPLAVTALPKRRERDWQPLCDALPDFRQGVSVAQPTAIDLEAGQVRVFLPGFAKNQVKLTQYGPEITIEAGDQRHNINLPPPLRGQPVTGAKFQEGYLIISFF
jgi:arsenite-transporting ATPase